jgi:hypothetical protein
MILVPLLNPKFANGLAAWLCELRVRGTSMSARLPKLAALACAAIIVGAAATASARPKKHTVERPSTETASCYGTPIIMQGMDCPKRPVRVETQEPGKRVKRPQVSARGSGGYVAPVVPPTPSLNLSQPSVTPYIPPPINSPSDRVIQYNHSFQFNQGLGNNPTGLDAYIRYNLNR